MKHPFDNIPSELKTYRQWVCWKYELNPKNPDKPKKPLFDPVTRIKASVNAPETWASFTAAVRCLKKGGFNGIGFVFTREDPYVGIDLDNCRDEKSGEIDAWAETIMNRIVSYTEVSPSGSGIHIIVKGKLPDKGKRVNNIEIYDRDHYFTITGVLP